MRALTLAFVMLLAQAAQALSPDEMLADPALETRARALDHEIRCVQCQSESVASSNADWARDARRTIRDQITAGASNAEVKAFFVERYGEYVLMDPPKTGSNLLLWLAGPAMALLAFAVGFGFLRGRAQSRETLGALSGDEQERLARILERSD